MKNTKTIKFTETTETSRALTLVRKPPTGADPYLKCSGRVGNWSVDGVYRGGSFPDTWPEQVRHSAIRMWKEYQEELREAAMNARLKEAEAAWLQIRTAKGLCHPGFNCRCTPYPVSEPKYIQVPTPAGNHRSIQVSNRAQADAMMVALARLSFPGDDE